MAEKSKIEWTDSTWNPWYGCTPVSEGCWNCYARRNWRLLGLKPGEVRMAADKTFEAPLHWKDPRKIFVCSIGDFFHEAVDPCWRVHALGIMTYQRHKFIIVTKRPERAIESLYGGRNQSAGTGYFKKGDYLPNVWILATVENQEQADRRIPELLRLREYGSWPVLGISAEPMLGEIDLSRWVDKLDWIVAGGESGQKARPMHPDWVRSLRDQAVQAGVPFFFKQWGAWCLKSNKPEGKKIERFGVLSPSGKWLEGTTGWNGRDIDPETGEAYMVYVGKKDAGCLLDGREWKEFPDDFDLPKGGDSA